MVSTKWIVPVPAGTRHKDREVLGVLACHGDVWDGEECPEWVVVRKMCNGKAYAPCDHFMSSNKCDARYDFPKTGIGPQTRERFEAVRDTLDDAPEAIREFVLKAWGELEIPKHEKFAKPVAGKSDTKPEAAQEHQGEPAGETRDEPADPGRNKPDQAGDVQSDTAEGTGPEPGDDEGELGIFGM